MESEGMCHIVTSGVIPFWHVQNKRLDPLSMCISLALPADHKTFHTAGVCVLLIKKPQTHQGREGGREKGNEK